MVDEGGILLVGDAAVERRGKSRLRGVLAHQTVDHAVPAEPENPRERRLGFQQPSREQEQPHDRPAFQPPVIGENRFARDRQHLFDRREGDGGIVGRARIRLRRFCRRVLVIGKENIDRARKRVERRIGFISPRVPHDGERKSPFPRRRERRKDRGEKLRPGDQVDIRRPGFLQFEKDRCEPFDRDRRPRLASRDRAVLTVDTAQPASRKEDGARTLVPDEAGFLPRVERGARDPEFASDPAGAGLARRAVDPAGARAEAAGTVGVGVHGLSPFGKIYYIYFIIK